jgi:D-3-phosphoglycerate dehydrogenase
VAVAIAEQIIDYLKNGTIRNAVNVPSITGELLVNLGPFLSLADQIGKLQSQLIEGPLKEVIIEFAGDFLGLDLTPVSTAVLRGILAAVVKDDVNFVNARIMAKERGIKVTETASLDSDDYINLITVKAITTEMTNMVAGTLFGKKESRIVRINTFRLEMIPIGHLALIYNIDRPGSIGEIGSCLGKHHINIGRMQVGQEEEGNRNIIFLCTDTPIPEDVIAELRSLPSVKMAIPLEF